MQPVTEFEVDLDGRRTPILEAPLIAPQMGHDKDDELAREYLVRVAWHETRPSDQPFWKPGMYANQNSVTRLRQTFTIEELAREFAHADEDEDISSDI